MSRVTPRLEGPRRRTGAPRALDCVLALGLLVPAAAHAQGSAAGEASPVPTSRATSVAVLEITVQDNSMNGNSDSLRTWMAEAGIEPTALLRQAIGHPATYATMRPRPAFAAVDGSRVTQALASNGLGTRDCRKDCVVTVGRALGADRVITGEVTKLSVLIWFVTARVTDVRTGKVLRQDELEVKGVITDLMPKVMVVLARRFATV